MISKDPIGGILGAILVTYDVGELVKKQTCHAF